MEVIKLKVSVKGKLFLSFGIIIILTLTLGVYSIFAIKLVKDKSNEINVVWFKGLDTAYTITSAAADLRGREYKHILTSDINNKADVEKSMENYKSIINNKLEEYKKTAVLAEDIMLYNEVKKEWEAYLNIHNKILELSNNGYGKEAETLTVGDGLVEYNKLSKAEMDLIKFNQDRAQQAYSLNEVVYNRAKLILISTLTIIILLSVIVSYVIGTGIAKRLKIANNLLNKTGRYDLIYDQEAYEKFKNYKSQDDISLMLEVLTKMRLELRTLINNIKQSSKETVENAESISIIISDTAQVLEGVAKATNEIAQGSTELAKNVQNSSERLNKLSEEIDKVATSTDIMKNCINITSTANKEGLECIGKLKEAVNDNIMVSEKVAHQIKLLSNKSESIGKITDTIKSITNQINLLSLNAAIEAARAGEQGRGFAVVSDEIRKLANETVLSTKEIEEIINEVRSEVAIVENQIIETSQVISKTTNASKETEKAFESIDAAIEDIISQISLLIQNICNIDENKNKVVVAISEISAIAEQSASATEEISASVQEEASSIEQISDAVINLKNISISLEELINKFKT